MPKTYKHLFFDLDHTLWDFERSAEETKQEIFEKLQLKQLGIDSYEEFRKRYVPINQNLWALYREEKITKDELNFHRFYDTLLTFGIDEPALATQIADIYLEGVTSKTYLFPYTRELLEYLFPKYPLYIITNGFEEVQYGKLKNSGLEKYFTGIYTSEAAGCKKPDLAFFSYALNLAGAKPEESLMIGDDLEIDILSARDAGMDQLFVNHNRIAHTKAITFEVFGLKEITTIL